MIVESYEDVIVLSGDMRSNQWETVHTAISLMLKRHPSGVVLDCAGLGHVTSEGAETFRDAMDFIKRHQDARIIVAAVPDAVMEVLKGVPEVRSQLPIAPTVADAKRSIDLLVHHDDEHEPGAKKKKKPTVSDNARNLVVCLYTGTSLEEDDAAMAVASEIADSRETRIHFVCALVVPRELPLDAPLPKSEESAMHAVGRAKSFFDDRGLVHDDRVERARDVASALVNVVEEIPTTEIIVLPLKSDPNLMDENAKMMKNVLGKVGAEVIFVRRPL